MQSEIEKKIIGECHSFLGHGGWYFCNLSHLISVTLYPGRGCVKGDLASVTKGRVQKNVKVWSLTKLANPPPPMLKYGLLIVKIFIQFFWLPICFKPY